MRSVCFVNPYFYLNTATGAEVQVYLMAKGLADLGTCRVSYATMDIRESGFVDGISMVRIERDPGGDGCSYGGFCRALDSVAPDAVLQLGRKQFTYYAARYCRSRRVPFLFSAASDIDCRPLRELPRFFGEYRPRRALNPANLYRALLKDIRTLRGMKQATCAIAQTKRQQAALRRIFRTEPVLFQNPHEVPPTDRIVKDDPPMVLWLANIKSVKRPELFLKIAERLRNGGCRIVMAGRMIEERFRPEIEDAGRKGVLEYVEEVSFEQSNELFSRARVFVMTSRHEGLPNTLIQSWLHRTPTVSLGVDPDGLIEEQGLGKVVSTVDEAAHSIRALVNDSHLCDEVANAARLVAIERFGIASQSRRLDDIVRNVMDER